MVRAGALYFAIVIALIIAITTASLILLAAHYRNEYVKRLRYDRLLNNLNSGINYVLAQPDFKVNDTKMDLFGNQTDSLRIQRKLWGIYELASIQSYIATDTLKKVLLIGNETDSVVLYLSDEDRPLSMSGTTKITGNALIPKAGLKKAYADGKAYVSKDLLYKGATRHSDRTLKSLDTAIVNRLRQYLATKHPTKLLTKDTLKASFLGPVQEFGLRKRGRLESVSLQGNIVLISETVLHISANAKLNGIQIYAPAIKVDAGFVGNCQLFARDSITVDKGAVFHYPSVLGVLGKGGTTDVPTIRLGDDVTFNGIIFSHEPQTSALQTMVSIEKKTSITGEVYCLGKLKVEKDVLIKGKVSCNTFVMRTPTTLYENFLIDVTFNRFARSNYYLSSKIFGQRQANRVLKWLN